MNRRRVLQQANLDKDMVIMTSDTNPKILARLYSYGLCASPDYMTAKEAEVMQSVGYNAASPFYFDKSSLGGFGYEDFEAFKYFKNVTSIAANGFYCSYIGKIKLPPNITSIGNSAFRNCAIKDWVNIPASVTHIDNYAFGYSNVYSFDIVFESTIPFIIGQNGNYPNAFSDVGTKIKNIYVPDEALEAYQIKWSSVEANYRSGYNPVPVLKSLSQCPYKDEVVAFFNSNK